MDVDEMYASGGGGSEISLHSLVNNVVVYIASVDENHFPIKRADITKNALPPKSGKKYHHVMEEAKELLKETFGLMLMDLDGTEKNYVTVSKFTKPQSTNLFQVSTEYRRKRALLLIVLSYVYMMDNSVSEDKLWKYLTQLGLVDRTVNFVHPHFGNVRRICTTDFVRHMYLKIETVPGTTPPENIFVWGPRANIEFNKLEVLKFVALMSNTEPQTFTAHWAKLHPGENNEARVDNTPSAPARQPAQDRSQSHPKQRRP